MSIIHSPYYLEIIHSSDFMENIYSAYFMEIVHSSYFLRLFIHLIYGKFSFISLRGQLGYKSPSLWSAPAVAPGCSCGPASRWKGEAEDRCACFTSAAQQQQKALLNRRRFSHHFTPHSSSSVSSTFKSVCAVMRSFC